MLISNNVLADERASYGNCYLALGYIQGKLDYKIEEFISNTGVDPTKMEVFERKDQKLYFTLGLIDEDLYKSIKREGHTTKNMWCTSGKGYVTRYNLDSDLNLIANNPKKFIIKNKNDFFDASGVFNPSKKSPTIVDLSQKNPTIDPSSNLTRDPFFANQPPKAKISKSILDKINEIDFKSPLPNCLAQTPTQWDEWAKLWRDGELIKPGSLNNCQVAVAYDGKGDYEDRVLFVGEYQNGRRDGDGVMIFTNGHMYDGQWDGWFHGEGVYTFKNGKKWSGLWHDGKSLENKCKSFGFNPETTYSKRCQEIMFDEYSKN
tara:strand:- start:187 stop:1140 length:954 start_codon:yes stop_codon:yes gene_type:complete